jgi:hypothetical protein
MSPIKAVNWIHWFGEIARIAKEEDISRYREE